MKNYVRVPIGDENHSFILIKCEKSNFNEVTIEDSREGTHPTSLINNNNLSQTTTISNEQVIESLPKSLRDVFEKQVKPLGNMIMDTLKDINSPSEIGAEFNVALKAEAGKGLWASLIPASASTETSFKISLKWKNNQNRPEIKE
ncbi:MAG: hypothetical protein LWY06_09315 [Firmicutes bacterium]|nr:hypothetical protein [Bacillota bacterium]